MKSTIQKSLETDFTRRVGIIAAGLQFLFGKVSEFI